MAWPVLARSGAENINELRDLTPVPCGTVKFFIFGVVTFIQCSPQELISDPKDLAILSVIFMSEIFGILVN
ncbi:hypothetical protein SDC9_182462 [bioreactor metagenome]|uniref:Uncharacterized protein n=1 Tax=bioreactor metagenome TaxID=1076179 RepID=A0A645H7M2_9ZZZZ